MNAGNMDLEDIPLFYAVARMIFKADAYHEGAGAKWSLPESAGISGDYKKRVESRFQ